VASLVLHLKKQQVSQSSRKLNQGALVYKSSDFLSVCCTVKSVLLLSWDVIQMICN
jgi:hypothetical protein